MLILTSAMILYIFYLVPLFLILLIWFCLPAVKQFGDAILIYFYCLSISLHRFSEADPCISYIEIDDIAIDIKDWYKNRNIDIEIYIVV